MKECVLASKPILHVHERASTMKLQHRTSHSRRGAIAVLAACTLVFLLAMVAFSVDLGYLCWVDAQTQTVADAAALAGVKGLTTSPSQAQSSAIACAQLNTANGKSVVLQSSNVVLGTWNTTSNTFTALTGSAQSQANACQVTVSTPVNFFFAPVFGDKGANAVATAIAAAKRWDVVMACDISESFETDLPQAVSGMQAVLSLFNQYSPQSNIGVVTFGSQGWTNASLQPVGANYDALNTTIGDIKDCNAGGPPCGGSDLAAGMATAVSLFSAAGYSPPPGTRQAIIFISDGASNVTSKSLNWPLSDAADNTLAATEASNAWTNNGISVFSLLYYHGSDSATDTDAMEALVQGYGTFMQELNPAELSTDMQTMVLNNMPIGLVY